ncbi:MAG: type II secretion system protein [Planctomycetes bacterium]|nr:type II secretion system protein [Planctomycetota bacterium]
MRRRAFTLIELTIASVITSLVALAVASTLSTTASLMEREDRAAASAAVLARAEARMADHAERARLILHQDADEVLLWLPSEPFTSSATNTAEYDRIDANELAWYVMDASTGTLSLLSTTNRVDRTVLPLATDWAALRLSMQVQSRLTRLTVLNDVAEGEFRVESSDACSVRRFTFSGRLSEAAGGVDVELGGRLPNGQRHPDCP